MNILFKGNFLREGLCALGHNVFNLSLDDKKSFQSIIDDSGCLPDLVVVEFFGNTAIPEDIYKVNATTVAYVIDAPINEFWLIYMLKSFDYVFVDQQSFVKKLMKCGIKSTWLPLSAYQTDFRMKHLKKYFITFVGRRTEHRVKRTNILKLILQKYDINIVEGVSRDQMQTLFAESNIVLNENFFSGVNLRTFQAMASGSLLLTEKEDDLDELFIDGVHYLSYTPQDLLEKIDYIANNLSKVEQIAKAGQEECRQKHTSVKRAELILKTITSKLITVTVQNESDFILSEAYAKYKFCLRFGGDYSYAVKQLSQVTCNDNNFGKAQLALGNINAVSGKIDCARKCLRAAIDLKNKESIPAFVLLILTYIYDNDFGVVESLFNVFKFRLRKIYPDLDLKVDFTHKDFLAIKYNLFLSFSQLMYRVGNRYSVGFFKQNKDLYPTSDLELAFLSWDLIASNDALDHIVYYCEEGGIGPEALPFLKKAILAGEASDKNILKSISFAEEYYDFELVKTLAKPLSNRLKAKSSASI